MGKCEMTTPSGQPVIRYNKCHFIAIIRYKKEKLYQSIYANI